MTGMHEPFIMRGVHVLDASGSFTVPIDVAVVGGKVQAADKNLPVGEFRDLEDFTGQWLMPGIFDLHARLVCFALVELLTAWRDHDDRSISDVVFGGESGQRFLSPPVVLRRHLYPAMAAAEVRRVGPTQEKRTFSFRHTFAKRALESGAQIPGFHATSATRRSM